MARIVCCAVDRCAQGLAAPSALHTAAFIFLAFFCFLFSSFFFSFGLVFCRGRFLGNVKSQGYKGWGERR